MAKLRKLEGLLNDTYRFNFDGETDVLRMRLNTEHDTSMYAEETGDGIILHRSEIDDRVVAFTLVGWQKQFNKADLTSQLAMLKQAEALLPAA